MIWSFSRIDYSCLADFYQHYILNKEGLSNGWSELGSFSHGIVEEVGKDNLTFAEGLNAFKENYWESIKTPFPTTPYWKDPEMFYYDRILPYFERDKWWHGDIIAVEEHLEFTLPSGEKFQGFIDQVIDEDGLKIKDFKVAKRYIGKKLKEKKRQLLLYSYGYHQKHGVYPKWIEFDYFQRAKFEPETMLFNEDEMAETIDWAEKQIKLLKTNIQRSEEGIKGLFLPNYDELLDKNKNRNMYCNNICSYRENCPFINGDKLIKYK